MSEKNQTEPKPEQPSTPIPKEKPKLVSLVRNYLHRVTHQKSAFSELPQMFASLFSEDRPTRRMSMLFFLSLFGFFSVSLFGLLRYWEAKRIYILTHAKKHATQIEDLIKKEAEIVKRRASLIGLGSFTLELKEVPKAKITASEINMAEAEIVVLCDKPETRHYIEKNMIFVRNQLTNALTAVDREELISLEGKKRLKMVIIRRLNEWLPHGKVEDVYFSRLLVN